MRHTLLVSGLTLVVAAMFSFAPAMAEMGGPIKNDTGQCRVYGSNNNSGSYYHWEACPKPKAAAVVVHHRHHRG